MEIYMKLEDIISEWKQDAKIDRVHLTEESLKTALLHSKYYEIYMFEKQLLKTHEEKFKNFELAKWLYYQGKMDEAELKQRGWEQFDLKLLKTDIQRALDGDSDIIEYKLKISQQYEKVEFVKSILQSIHQRTFAIKNAIEHIKFESGG